MSKVKDTYFGGAEKKAAKAERRAQQAAGRLTAAQLAQTESEFRPFIQQGAGDSLNAQRVLLGLGALDTNAQRREQIQREISSLESEQQTSASQFGGKDNWKGGGGWKGKMFGKLMASASHGKAEARRKSLAKLDDLREELDGLGPVPQGTAQEQQRQAFQNFIESPGQKFIKDRAQRNLLRNSSAIGGLGGGNIRSALVQQGAGFAQQDFQNQFNRLGVTSEGEQAMIGRQQQAATNLGNLRSGFGAQQGAALIGAGQAKSSGLVAQAAGLRAGVQQVANTVKGAMDDGFGGALQGFTGN